MKKMIIAVCAVAVAAFAHAATVNWSCAGATAADLGSKVYLLSSIEDTYESLAAFEATALDIGEVVKKTTKYQVSAHDVTKDAITKTSNYYLAIVNDDTISYVDVTAGMQAKVFDAAAQEASLGTYNTTLFSTIAASSTTSSISSVPEPTSGLLLLLGMAGLALRRKQK